MKILFVLKRRQGYGCWNDDLIVDNSFELSSGLLNSVKLLVDMINIRMRSVDARYVVVQDNNCIDREITLYRPDIVVIEAFWVVPSKFDILKSLHPNVKWIIRSHSKSEFLAGEGSAYKWICEYLEKGLYVACNSVQGWLDIKYLARSLSINTEHVLYLPNYYHIKVGRNIHSIDYDVDILDIGCFGAVRPLKNHLPQVIAALEFANKAGKRINFHINSSRVEGQGEGIIKNIRNIFGHLPQHYLVEHDWMIHEDFLTLTGSMHMNLQVSLSETFNIVAADSVYMGVPVIVSNAISWLNNSILSCKTDASSIKNEMFNLYRFHAIYSLVRQQQQELKEYNESSVNAWENFFERF